MDNWIIFLLHFMAAICYLAGSNDWHNKNTNDLGAFLLWILAITLTITAAWV